MPAHWLAQHCSIPGPNKASVRPNLPEFTPKLVEPNFAESPKLAEVEPNCADCSPNGRAATELAGNPPRSARSGQGGGEIGQIRPVFTDNMRGPVSHQPRASTHPSSRVLPLPFATRVENAMFGETALWRASPSRKTHVHEIAPLFRGPTSRLPALSSAAGGRPGARQAARSSEQRGHPKFRSEMGARASGFNESPSRFRRRSQDCRSRRSRAVPADPLQKPATSFNTSPVGEAARTNPRCGRRYRHEVPNHPRRSGLRAAPRKPLRSTSDRHLWRLTPALQTCTILKTVSGPHSPSNAQGPKDCNIGGHE